MLVKHAIIILIGNCKLIVPKEELITSSVEYALYCVRPAATVPWNAQYTLLLEYSYNDKAYKIVHIL
jgi:hypothetical protein